MKKIVLLISLIIAANALFINKSNGNAPDTVYCGTHIMNIYELDASTNSFYADFYLWCKWKGEIDPFKNLEFVNSIDKWGFTANMVYDSTLTLKDGYFYNIIHAEGRFHYTFKLDRYPMDNQTIGIVVENSKYSSKELVYIADEKNSGIQPDIALPGWKIKNVSIREYDHNYQSNFGMNDEDSERYSNLTFNVKLSRPLQYFLFKLLLPLLIVLLSSLGATWIFPGYIDARIYAPIGALLTAVFLQQSYTDDLPDISYVVLIDKIYVITYVVIIAGIIQAIITANMVKDEEEAQYEKVKKIDKIFQIITLSFFLIASAIVIIF